MRPMDSLGNVLNKGDMVVLVNENGTVLQGFVDTIKEGGIVAASLIDPKGTPGGQITPGEMVIALPPTRILYDPRQPTRCKGVYKVVKPPELDNTHKA